MPMKSAEAVAKEIAGWFLSPGEQQMQPGFVPAITKVLTDFAEELVDAETVRLGVIMEKTTRESWYKARNAALDEAAQVANGHHHTIENPCLCAFFIRDEIRALKK